MITMNLPIKYLQAISLFAAKKDVRYYLNGVAITGEHLVATNGSYIGALPITIPACEDMDVDVIIPLETINTFLKSISTADKKKYNFELTIEGGIITLTFLHTSITTKGIDGIYPQWERVLAEVDEPVAHGMFNWDYMSLFQKASKILSGKPVGKVGKVELMVLVVLKWYSRIRLSLEGHSCLKDFNMTQEEQQWYYITYQCPNCNELFADVWSCACNGECPHCKTKDIEPIEYEEINEWV